MLYSHKETTSNIPLANIKEHYKHATWVEISKEALEHNIKNYKTVIGSAQFAAVIKSNAYGHSLEHIGLFCDQHTSINYLCVVSISEALQLRLLGIKKHILVLSILDSNLEQAIVHDIDLVIYDITTAVLLSQLAKKLNKKVCVHIKIDTGLSRLGILHDQIATVQYIYNLPFIIIRGIFTHFSSSESDNQTFTNMQIQHFDQLLHELEILSISIPLKHTACSAASTANNNSHYNFVRVGIGLYGLWPSPANKQLTKLYYPQFSLKPVLTWKTKILQIKEIAAGTYVGYDRTHQVQKASRIATIPVGYWDGYDRLLSNKGKVAINNQIAPIIGRIAMNICMVDVTNLDIAITDDVILLGNYPGVTADDIAHICNTINYEIVTRINPLLPRIIF